MAQILLKNSTTGQRVYVDDNSPDYQFYIRGGFVVDKPVNNSNTTTSNGTLIGPTKWSELQKKYSPATLETMITRVKNPTTGVMDIYLKSTTPSTTSETGAEETTDNKDALTEDQKKFFDDWSAKIDAMDITSGQKATLKEVLKGDYVSGVVIPTNDKIAEIIRQAATDAEIDLSPHYQTLTQREIEDFQADLSNIRERAANYQKQEASTYAQKLASAKQTLRASGRTFSGTSLKLLGGESALVNAPGIEGTMPTDRRLGYEAQNTAWQEEARKQAQPAERLLGSSIIQGMNYNISNPYATGIGYNPVGTSRMYNPLGNVSQSDIESERIREIEKSKWNRVSNNKPWI